MIYFMHYVVTGDHHIPGWFFFFFIKLYIGLLTISVVSTGVWLLSLLRLTKNNPNRYVGRPAEH